MFFEGSEKKVEVILQPSAPDLRSMGTDFWKQVVQRSNATLLSSVHNEECDAYLLSESSLFVWKDRFLMITCGVISLVDAVLFFLEHFDNESLAFVCYQRKNEYKPQLQKSTFQEDIERLSTRLPAQAFRLGSLDTHPYYLCHLDTPYQPKPDDTTAELLMYHITGDVADYLRGPNQTAEAIREHLQLALVLDGFQIDDYLFTPYGYSMNAIRGAEYATIHITPQSENSYVSFETNMPTNGQQGTLLHHFLMRLQPGSWDLMTFNSQPTIPPMPNQQRMGACDLELKCGFHVRFHHYQQRETTQIKRFDIPTP
jgi:S-adenosylmethionine decarboxylase